MLKKILTRFIQTAILAITAFTLNNSIYAGSYIVNGTNYLQTGLIFIAKPSPVDVSAAGFTSVAGTKQLHIAGLSINKTQNWKNMVITTSGAGNYTIELLSSSGLTIYSSGTQTAALTVNLSNISGINTGDTLQMLLSVNPGITISEIKFTYDGDSAISFPTPYQITQGKMKIAYDLSANGKVTVSIYDAGGRLVRNIIKDKLQTAKDSRFDTTALLYWNGKDQNGRYVSTGIYTLMVDITYTSAVNGETRNTSYFRFLVAR